MNQEELIEIWRFEEQQPFIGWDFSHLEGRMLKNNLIGHTLPARLN